MAPGSSNGQWTLAIKVVIGIVAVVSLVVTGFVVVNSKVDKAELRPAVEVMEQVSRNLESSKLDRDEWQTWRTQDAIIQQLLIDRLEALADEHKEFTRKDD